MKDLSVKERLILVVVISVVAWAAHVHNRPGPAPGTLDFRHSNYPERR